MKFKLVSVVTSVVQIVIERSQKTLLQKKKKNMLTSNPTHEEKTASFKGRTAIRGNLHVENGSTQAEATAVTAALPKWEKSPPLSKRLKESAQTEQTRWPLCYFLLLLIMKNVHVHG